MGAGILHASTHAYSSNRPGSAEQKLACPERLVRAPAITVLIIEMHFASATALRWVTN